MFTSKRLYDAYRRSEKIHIDDRSQIVFMSDIHRGDNSVSDEFGQNRLVYMHALDYYYDDGYTYVEVGDGDELWEVPDYRYIARAHPAVFEKLEDFQKENRLIMISGNHNYQIMKHDFVHRYMEHMYDSFLDETIDILPGVKPMEAVTFIYEPTGQKIFVVHGHQGEIVNDYLKPIGRAGNRFIWRYIHRLGFHYTANPTRNRYKPARKEKACKKWLEGNDLMLICGHTHRPRLAQKGELPYFNTGCAIHPRGITAIELTFGELALVTWTVHTRRDGMIYVRRKIMKGPVQVSDFADRPFKEMHI